ncbi:MAG: 2-oxoacid:acceptor oxidoreductase family protein [Dehalococcoidales bacterium]|nr:2-oxoacid:acceptor oxidoreductase family protein [Dehalococcoidales bacterium]MDD4465282.1 2-oxoacid:acceptor oxidoreductase family protein [Dehalococcoidales bacterium]MDD5402089.1 2-oxoacid:acceptor oxidoreductase family protein [Dehalococcoidales bacterium]
MREFESLQGRCLLKTDFGRLIIVTKHDTIEIRWHGRGGQGAVTSAELIARAAIETGGYAQAFPAFGPERRGAPVLAFDRISSGPIRSRAEVNNPDIVVVLDPRLMDAVNVTAGLKEGGLLAVNTRLDPGELSARFDNMFRVATVDANTIAREVLGVPIVNTTMIGVLIKASGILKPEELFEPLKDRFGRLAEKNINAMKRAFEETRIKEQ